jgi:hypothetical protein
MAVIILDDQRASNRDKKNDANISQGNERAWLFDSPLTREFDDENWAWNSEVGRFFNSVWNETRNAISPIANEANSIDALLQAIEAERSRRIDPILARQSKEELIPDLARGQDLMPLLDEAEKLGFDAPPLEDATKLIREGGVDKLLNDLESQATSSLNTILQDNEDIIKKWGALNQSGDAELARTALYEHDRKEFERVASTTETVVDKGVSGGIYQVDNTLSNQAFRLFRPQGSLLNYYNSLGIKRFEATNARQALVKLNTFDQKAQEARDVRFAEEDAAEAARIEGLQSGLTRRQLRDPGTVPETEVTETVDPNVSVPPEADPIFGVSGISNVPPPDPADDPIFGNFGAQADTVTVQQQTEERQQQEQQQQTSTGLTAAQIMAEQEADRDEIYSLLQEQFGGASYFFRDQALNMLLGVTADGTIVSYDDESRETEIRLMDYIVNNGITSMTRVKGLLQKTEWWQTTDVARRTYDVMWGEMSDPERQEFLEPTTDALTKEAQFLGFDLSEQDAFTLAQTLAKNGDSEDTEAIREIIFSQLQMQNTVSELSGFAAQKDNLRQLARSYYAPLPEQGEGSIEQWAELLYTGESTVEAYEQNLKQIAVSRFPTLDKVIREMGLTPGQYFAPYKQQIESMLGRNVDLYNEFSDVIEYIPDGGTDARAMNLSEVKNFVRALPEWQQTDDAKDQARALAFSIGQTFGEVA